MALRITQIKTLQETENGNVAPVPVLGAPQAITIATAAATSTTISAPMCMIYAEENTHFAINATATTGSYFIAAGERFTIGGTEDSYITAKNTA